MAVATTISIHNLPKISSAILCLPTSPISKGFIILRFSLSIPNVPFFFSRSHTHTYLIHFPPHFSDGFKAILGVLGGHFPYPGLRSNFLYKMHRHNASLSALPCYTFPMSYKPQSYSFGGKPSLYAHGICISTHKAKHFPVWAHTIPLNINMSYLLPLFLLFRTVLISQTHSSQTLNPAILPSFLPHVATILQLSQPLAPFCYHIWHCPRYLIALQLYRCISVHLSTCLSSIQLNVPG